MIKKNMIKQMKKKWYKNEEKLGENCNFPKKEKLQLSLFFLCFSIFFHVFLFFIFVLSFF